MVTRFVLVISIVAWSSIAAAQVRPSEVKCTAYETQAECHARLKCKDGEEVEDCQRRLLQCKPGEPLNDCIKRASSAANNNNNNTGNQNQNNGNNNTGNQNQNNDNHDRDRDRERDGGDRGDRERGDRDRERERERGEREREPDRGDRGDRGRGRGHSSSRRSERRGSNGSHDFVANKKFGIGLELGEPTGIIGKYFLSKSHALDFGLGWIYHQYYYGDGFHAYADFLWHPVSLASTPSFELPFYIGIGGRYWQFDYRYMGVDYSASALGIRVPLGISFDLNNSPIDIFIQLVPVLDFLGDTYYRRYGDRAHLGIDGSVGIRFWF